MATAPTAPVTPSFTVSEAVDFIIAAVERTQRPPSEVIDTDDLLDMLDPSEFRHLARVGLIQIATTAMHHERTGSARDELASTTRRRRGYRGDGSNPRTRSVLASISMEDAEGKIKPLESFTLEDTEVLRITCEKQATGWTKRGEWAARAGELLRKNKRAKSVARLPEKSVAELRQLAAEAWS